jgi:hypothetical protein
MTPIDVGFTQDMMPDFVFKISLNEVKNALSCFYFTANHIILQTPILLPSSSFTQEINFHSLSHFLFYPNLWIDGK